MWFWVGAGFVAVYLYIGAFISGVFYREEKDNMSTLKLGGVILCISVLWFLGLVVFFLKEVIYLGIKDKIDKWLKKRGIARKQSEEDKREEEQEQENLHTRLGITTRKEYWSTDD